MSPALYNGPDDVVTVARVCSGVTVDDSEVSEQPATRMQAISTQMIPMKTNLDLDIVS